MENSKKNIISDLLSKTDPEKIRNLRLESKNSMTLAYQLGILIGENISGKIPTLSCDGIFSDNIIKVTDDEESEVRRLEGIWSDNYDRIDKKKSEKFFQEYRSYVWTLQEKYFPKTITLNTRLLNIPESDMDEFKRGVALALWDCDFCSYDINIENIEVRDNDNLTFTEIILKYLGH